MNKLLLISAMITLTSIAQASVSIDGRCLAQAVSIKYGMQEISLGSGISLAECMERSTSMQSLLYKDSDTQSILFTYQEDNKQVKYALSMRGDEEDEEGVILQSEYENK